jgi:hypothetical protein
MVWLSIVAPVVYFVGAYFIESWDPNMERTVPVEYTSVLDARGVSSIDVLYTEGGVWNKGGLVGVLNVSYCFKVDQCVKRFVQIVNDDNWHGCVDNKFKTIKCEAYREYISNIKRSIVGLNIDYIERHSKWVYNNVSFKNQDDNVRALIFKKLIAGLKSLNESNGIDEYIREFEKTGLAVK